MEPRCSPTEVAALAERDFRWRYLTRFGNFTLAYSTLDADLKTFHVPEKGYVAFSSVKPDPSFPETTLALADPVCAPCDRAELLRAFVEKHRDARGQGPAFVHVGLETAGILSDLGYFITQLGTENRIPLAEFNLDGHSRRQHRRAVNNAAAAGVKVEPIWGNDEGAAAIFEELPTISVKWIGTHAVNDREAGFLNRKAVYAHEPFVRKAVMRDSGGNIVGFAFYDPIFDDNRVVGYVSSITRFLRSTMPNARLYTDIEMLKTFHTEGVRWLELGVSPCYGLERPPPPLRFGRVPHRIFRALYEGGESIYAFKGLAMHKGVWHGEEVPTYVAFPTARPIQHLLAGFKLIGMNLPTGVEAAGTVA